MLNAKKLIDLILLMDPRAVFTQADENPNQVLVHTCAQLNFAEALSKFGESKFEFITYNLDTPRQIELNIEYNRDEKFSYTYLEGTINYAVELVGYLICKHVFATQPSIAKYAVSIKVEGDKVTLVSPAELQNPELNLIPIDVYSLVDALAVNIPCYAFAHENLFEELKSAMADVEVPGIGIAKVDCILNTHEVEILPLKKAIIQLFTKPEKPEAQPVGEETKEQPAQ